MIKVGEVGKTIRLYAAYDLSGNSALKMHFTKPDGTTFTVENPRVTAPAVQVVDQDLGTLPASTYWEMDTAADEFDQAGDYCVYGEYTDPTPKTFFGDSAKITVESLTCEAGC